MAVLAFLFQDWVRDRVKEFFENNIKSYRDDIDLQNLIDSLQKIVSSYPVTSFMCSRRICRFGSFFLFATDLSYSVANSAMLQMCCFVLSASGRQDILRYSAVLTVNVEALPSIHLSFDLLDLFPCSDQCCTSLSEK